MGAISFAVLPTCTSFHGVPKSRCSLPSSERRVSACFWFERKGPPEVLEALVPTTVPLPAPETCLHPALLSYPAYALTGIDHTLLGKLMSLQRLQGVFDPGLRSGSRLTRVECC